MRLLGPNYTRYSALSTAPLTINDEAISLAIAPNLIENEAIQLRIDQYWGYVD
jgi:hypothetical protein